MIITTTGQIEGYKIKEYKDIIFGATLREIFKADNIGKEAEVFDMLKEKAARLGANAIVGIHIDYKSLGHQGNMFIIVASGTAVVVEKE